MPGIAFPAKDVIFISSLAVLPVCLRPLWLNSIPGAPCLPPPPVPVQCNLLPPALPFPSFLSGKALGSSYVPSTRPRSGGVNGPKEVMGL